MLSFFMFISILQIASSVIALTGNEPWFLPDHAAGIIIQVINPQIDSVTAYPGSQSRFANSMQNFQSASLFLAAYFVVALVLTVVIAKKKRLHNQLTFSIL
jgi:hypothetical protein